ncbi:MAG TPA: caspase family protein [Longimicrobiaceae bacterium]|nr:caspase family protein [Longimicrobiaceae bacterium]
MPKGISINIGLRTAGGDCCSLQTLTGSENDAREMARLARCDFIVRGPLLGGNATRRNVERELGRAAGELTAGDLLLLTYSGHGCRIFDEPPLEEPDLYDETWCLADEQFRDDHLHRRLAAFAEGVRILVISDSCHSGSIVFRAADRRLSPATSGQLKALRERRRQARSTTLKVSGPCESPKEIENLRLPLSRSGVSIRASVLLIAACREEQKAKDGDPNGLFTSALVRLWADGSFPGTYVEFIRQLHDEVSGRKPDQKPGWACDGVFDPAFLFQTPFTI